MDTFSTNFQLEQATPNVIFRAFDDGNAEGLKLRINDGAAQTTFPLAFEDIKKLIDFLDYYRRSIGQ